ncbi:MAG: DMT family transporter, partial [Pseudomonadota bacterium]
MILFTTCVLIWGSTWLAVPYQLAHAEPIVAVAWRYSLASIGLGTLILALKRSLYIPARFHKMALLIGLVIYCVENTLLYEAQKYMVSALLAVLSSCVIYLTVIFQRLMFKKALNAQVLIGATFGLIGIILIFLPELKNISFELGLALGLLLAALGFIFSAYGNVLLEHVLEEGAPLLQMKFYAMTYGMIMLYIV